MCLKGLKFVTVRLLMRPPAPVSFVTIRGLEHLEVVMKNHKFTMRCEKCGSETSVMVSVPKRIRRATGEIICFMNVCPVCAKKLKK